MSTESKLRSVLSDISKERSEVANVLYTILQARDAGWLMDIEDEFWGNAQEVCDQLRRS
jgi:hypothetical protein